MCVRFSVAVMLVAATAVGQQPDERDVVTTIGLFNNCEPMHVAALIPEPGGLFEWEEVREVAQSTATRRLRVARLLAGPQDGSGVLFVLVRVYGSGYVVSLEYRKLVTDLATGRTFPARTWGTTRGGLHGGTIVGAIRSTLSDQLDFFLAEYLRVNEPAC